MKSTVSTSDTLGLMLRDLDQFPMPDHEQQVELAKRVVAGDDAARKQMVAANLRLVVTGPAGTRTAAWTWPTWSRRAPSG